MAYLEQVRAERSGGARSWWSSWSCLLVRVVGVRSAKTDMERTAERREKTGVPLEGMIATNPINGERISVWIADYVLANYGTGAVMAVPAHDERDFAFAKKFALPIKQVVAPYFSAPEGHKDAVRADRPTVRRQTIQAFVKHWNEDKYLCLDWKHFGWHSGVIGGIDEGEDAITAATREIIEETGYQHLRFVKLLGGEIHKNFFAAHKNENRYAVSVGLLFELVDGAHVDPEPEQIKNHDAVWVAADKMRSFLSLNDAVYMWDALITGNECFAGDGLAVHSGFLNELPTWKAKEEVTSWLMEHGYGKKQITFKLRDWVFSRQRYWGEPIPIVRCAKCGHVPLPEDQLPLTLPDVAVYEPTDTGESPLANVRSWVETTCPRCGGPAERETDTMPNWAGSSWYFLRYCDPQNDRALADPEALKYWMPIDLYNGGMEHTTLHLLYSRFWHKFLWDLNIVPRECGNEPYARRHSHGLVLAEGGEKMSKSKGNVVNPDDVVREYGADAFRLYIMFMGPFEQSVPWDTNGLEGVRKFLDKVWNLGSIVARESKVEPSLLSLYHQTIKKVSEGIDRLQFNTCVSALMILVNAFQDAGEIPTECRDGFLQLLAPFAPHIAEELWHALGHKDSIHRSGWPIFDPNLLQEETFELVIQINGKVRDRVKMSRDTSEEEVKTQIMSLPKVQTWVEGKTLKQIVYVKGKLVNIVVD